jgi:glycosyltransferase involved in cell wall biosynthesis
VIVTYIHSRNQVDQPRVQVRCRNMVAAIRRTGWHQAHLLDLESFVSNTPRAREICSASDLLVIHRYLYGPVIRMLQSWKAYDKKVIVDIDEPVDRFSPQEQAYDFWMKGIPLDESANAFIEEDRIIDPPPIEQFRAGLRLTDGASVSSARLGDDWSAFVNVFHVPDYINLDQYLTIKQEHAGEVWLGLSARQMSPTCLENSGLRAALECVCRQRKQVRLCLIGFPQQAVDKLEISKEQKRFIPNYSLEEWPRLLASFDLGLAPADGEADIRTGWQRVLEYMVMKIPWIGSDLPPNRELSRYGWLVQNSPQTWERGLLEVIDHLEVYRSDAAGEPFLFALGQDVNENIGKVLEGYASILYRT